MPQRPAAASRLLPAVCALLLAGGCATPGPNHLYSLAPDSAEIVDRRTDDGQVVRLASHLLPAERALGVAYDRNTDHLFVRVAPGDLVKVVERPSGGLFGTLRLEGGATGALLGDLAIRSDDRNLFFIVEHGAAIAEARLDGRRVRTDPLPPESVPAAAVAIDQRDGTPLVLVAGPRGPIVALDRDRHEARRFRLAVDVAPTALAHDEATGHVYVPLARGGIGEFDGDGNLVRELPADVARGPVLLDAGQRSYVRVF